MKFPKLMTTAGIVGMNLATIATANADRFKITPDSTIQLPTPAQGLVSQILGGAQVVGVIVAIGMLMYAGFKYLTAGAGDKAKAKDMFVPMAVGAALIALAPTIGSWLFETLNK